MKTQKEKLRIIIYTPHHKIKGEVHLYQNSRLTDILNADSGNKDFLPITNAEIINLKDMTKSEVSFLSINKKFIEIVLEDDEAIALEKTKELIAKRKYQDAISYAQRAIKAAPNQAEGYYYLGFCLAKINELKAAKEAFENCLKLKPSLELQQMVEEALKTL